MQRLPKHNATVHDAEEQNRHLPVQTNPSRLRTLLVRWRMVQVRKPRDGQHGQGESRRVKANADPLFLLFLHRTCGGKNHKSGARADMGSCKRLRSCRVITLLTPRQMKWIRRAVGSECQWCRPCITCPLRQCSRHRAGSGRSSMHPTRTCSVSQFGNPIPWAFAAPTRRCACASTTSHCSAFRRRRGDRGSRCTGISMPARGMLDRALVPGRRVSDLRVRAVYRAGAINRCAA